MNEFEAVIRQFEEMEAEIQGESNCYEVGPLAIFTGWKFCSLFYLINMILFPLCVI